jgi:hypothetical protein
MARLTRKYFQEQGSLGGKKAAENMTPAERTIRAHKAAVAKAKKAAQKRGKP